MEDQDFKGLTSLIKSRLQDDKEQEGVLKTSSLPPQSLEEIGGPKGLEPTRFGDWEQKGRCTDF